MALYKKCPICGANLDPGEKCDCKSETSTDDKENDLNNKKKDESDRMEVEL